MNTYTHPTDNWKLFPDVVDVTLKPQHPVGSEVAEVKGKTRPLGGRELTWAASVGLPMETINWILWVETLGGVTPKPLDEIETADGTIWIIQKVTLATLGTRFKCICSKKDA